MQRLILAHALPTNVVHGFPRRSGASSSTSAARGDLFTPYRMVGVNPTFLRPDMGVADALNR